MSRKTDRTIFFLYMAGFFVIASTLALFQPLGDNPLQLNPPDEHARFLVPLYIYRHGVIPTGFEEEVRIPSYGFSYALYNAFPYIVQGYCMRFVGLFTDSLRVLLYTARFVNVGFGMAMAYVVYLLSRRLFDEGGFRWLFCFGVMYLPECLFLHTYVNSDSMCLLSTAMMVYALVLAYQDGFTTKACLLLAGGIILCALSYYNGYGFILSSILLFLAYFAGDKGYDWKTMFKKGSLISALVLMGIGWWFLRSYLVLDGDLLGLATRERMSIQYASPEVNPLYLSTYQSRGESLFRMFQEHDFFWGGFMTFVAVFGSMGLVGNVWMYRAFFAFFLVAVLSCLFLRKPKGDFLMGLPGWKRAFFHGNLVFCAVMPFLLLVYYAYAVDYQHQGRYLMPAVVPFLYYVARGWQKLTAALPLSARAKKAVVVLPIFLTVASVLFMVYVLSLPLYLQCGLVLE